MLDDKEQSAIYAKTFDLDCPQMELRQRGTTTPLILIGPGFIRQSPSGILVFKLYPKPMQSLFTWRFDQNAVINPGDWLPESHYFDLIAVDLKGRTWRSQYAYIDIDEGEGSIVHGNLREISASDDLQQPHPANSIRFLIPGNFDIPVNAVSKTVESEDGKPRRISEVANIAMFVTGDLTFQLRRESEQLVIGISSEESWPDHIESRMIEALQFVLARPLSWLILEKQTQQELQVWVQSHRFDSSTPALQPPLAYAHSEQRIVKSAWDLFDCYLRHIIHRSEPDQHPLSRILSLVREASTGSLHVAALTLGVMVEGILKQEFQHLWRAAEGEKEAWNELAGLVAKLPGPEFVKERTVNFMREAWTPSARACLQALTTAGVITANQLNAWVVLRNSYAHGKLPKIEVLRDLDNLVNKVTVLMYRLIFAAIGYQGPYTDYSAKGWPLSEFTLRALQNEPPELSL